MVCCGPVKPDRQMASRSVRHRHKHEIKVALNTNSDFENFILPDIYECAFNNRWSWSCDASRPRYYSGKPDRWDRTHVGIYLNGPLTRINLDWLLWHLDTMRWDREYHQRLQRK